MKRLDLVGKKFGRLEVISFSYMDKHNHSMWLCKCDCGNETIVLGTDIKNGHTISCGCYHKQRMSEIHKNKIVSEETKKKISINHVDVSGDKNPMFGIRRYGKNNPAFGIHKCGPDSHNYGKQASKESRKKMSDSHKGKIPWNKGIACSEETKKKISKSMTGKYVGSNSYNWNVNITEEERIIDRKYPEYYYWRQKVYERDKYVCQKCGELGGVLNAHHIESYSENKNLRTVVDNGITFCRACHRKFHSIYGRNDNNIKQLNRFLDNKPMETLNG